MRPTAASLSMPNPQGTITGGATARGFNDGTERGYPLLLTLSTRQVSDVVKLDEEILRPKEGRLRNDGQMPASEDPNERLEAIRQVCATCHLEGYPDTKVIDPIKDNFPSCTMPLSCTTPLTGTPAIMRNQDHARDCLSHVSLVRELLEQSTVYTDPVLLSSGANRLLQYC